MEVRGEIYMTNSDLVLLNEEQQKNGRAAVRQHPQRHGRQRPPARSADLCRSGGCGSSATAWATPRGLKAKTHIEFLDELRGYGLPATPHVECFPSFAAAVEHCEELIERLHELDFEIDGLVLKVNRFDQRERLGSTSKSPRWVIAYKFEKYEATTRLNDIRVQVGKTGAITPVADLEPVELAGTTVSRASLHNADEIERKDVRLGDVVVVEKAGKIIPHIVRVEKHLRKGSLRKFVFPTECPECGRKLVKDEGGVYIRCPNVQCPAQIKERIRYYASRNAMDIEGLGDELVDKLVEKGLVHTYGDLYRLKPEQLVDKLQYKSFGKKKAGAIADSINESKKRGLAHMLYGLAIPHVGGLQAVRLAEEFQTMGGVLAAGSSSIARLREVGAILAPMIHEWMHDDFLVQSIQGLKRAGVVMEYVHSPELDTLRRKKVPRIAVAGYDAEGMKKRLRHFVSKDAMSIEGLGEVTLATLVDEGLVRDYAGIYHLKTDQLSVIRTPMRTKEAQNLLSAIEKSKHRGLARLLNAMSIRHVGSRTALILSEAFGSMNVISRATVEEIEKALRSYRRVKQKEKKPGKAEKSKEAGVIARSIRQYLDSKFGNEIIQDFSELGVNLTAPKSGVPGNESWRARHLWSPAHYRSTNATKSRN